jgi:hypothetical protein
LTLGAGLAAAQAQESTNAAPPRQLFVGAITTNDLGNLQVPVCLVAQGDEAAIAFTLRFSTGALAYANYTVPVSDTNAVVVPLETGGTTNAPISATNLTSQVGAGELGFTLTLPPGSHLRAGNRSLVSAEFIPATNAADAIIAAGLALDSPGLTNTGGTNVPVAGVVTPQYMTSVTVTNLADQNGLFMSRLTFANPGSASVAGAWVLVLNLTNDTNGIPITLYNASGTTNDVRYLQLGPLPAGATAELTAEFYVSDRQTVPTPEYEVVVMPLAAPVISTNVAVRLDRQLFTNGVFYVEFLSLTNAVYYVQYASDLNSTNWSTSLPLIIGNGARVQWIDDGPPRTATPPASQTNRFYRVYQQ